MSDNGVAGLHPRTEQGWRAGLPSLMGAGYSSWWRTNDWWIQALLWTGIVNGSLATVIWSDVAEDDDLFVLYGVMTMFAAIAVAITMQEAIVGEKRSGTAAWVLSKPASRQAFMLAKLVPNAVGVVVTMILIPSAVLWVQLTVAGIEISITGFVLGAGVAALNLLFYLTLTLMLGTLFDSAGPVIAIPLAFAFGQQFIAGVPGLGSVIPWALVVSGADSEPSVIASLIAGEQVAAPGAVVVAILACAVFTAVAFWRWQRTEL